MKSQRNAAGPFDVTYSAAQYESPRGSLSHRSRRRAPAGNRLYGVRNSPGSTNVANQSASWAGGINSTALSAFQGVGSAEGVRKAPRTDVRRSETPTSYVR